MYITDILARSGGLVKSVTEPPEVPGTTVRRFDRGYYTAPTALALTRTEA
jgi:hypothetical protein